MDFILASTEIDGHVLTLFGTFLELPKSELTHVVLFLLRRRRFELEHALSIWWSRRLRWWSVEPGAALLYHFLRMLWDPT